MCVYDGVWRSVPCLIEPDECTQSLKPPNASYAPFCNNNEQHTQSTAHSSTAHSQGGDLSRSSSSAATYGRVPEAVVVVEAQDGALALVGQVLPALHLDGRVEDVAGDAEQ